MATNQILFLTSRLPPASQGKDAGKRQKARPAALPSPPAPGKTRRYTRRTPAAAPPSSHCRPLPAQTHRHRGIIESHVADDIEIAAKGRRRPVPGHGAVEAIQQPIGQDRSESGPLEPVGQSNAAKQGRACRPDGVSPAGPPRAKEPPRRAPQRPDGRPSPAGDRPSS